MHEFDFYLTGHKVHLISSAIHQIKKPKAMFEYTSGGQLLLMYIEIENSWDSFEFITVEWQTHQ